MKFISLLSIICILSSFFVISSSATVIENNDFVFKVSTYEECIEFIQPQYAPEYVNDFEFRNLATSNEFIQPVLYAPHDASSLRCTFRFKGRAYDWLISHNNTGGKVTFKFPLVFQANLLSWNYPSSIDIYISFDGSIYNKIKSFNDGILVNTDKGYKYLYFLEFELNANSFHVLNNYPYIRFNFNFDNYVSSNLRSVLFSTSNVSPINSKYSYIEFNGTDSIITPPSLKDPYTDVWTGQFGNAPNTYFEFENEIMGNVDHTFFNSFWANASAFDNFGDGIACVRSIFNEFINYNGSQWTWLYNLLMISLYIGAISFVLGFSVFITKYRK